MGKGWVDGLKFGTLTLVGGCLCAVAVVVTARSGHTGVEAAARGLIVGLPIAVGIYAWRCSPFKRFGLLLTLAGAWLFVATLAESTNATAYTIGRTAGWFSEVWFLYLVCAFPLGRLRGDIDRVLMALMVGILLFLYLPTLAVVQTFPVPSPWTSCESACPPNAFAITDTEPAVVEDVIRPLREFLTAALFVAVAVLLASRLRGATRLARRILAPLLVVAALRVVAYAGAILGRRVWPDSDLVEASSWLVALGMPMMAFAFLLGLVRWRLFIVTAIERLATRLKAHPGPDDLRAALADAFDDPTLEIVYWIGDEGYAGGTWGDADGRPIRPPPPGGGRMLTEVTDGGQPVAAILHDSALADDRAFISSATSYALMTLDNHRLSARAAALVRDVNESRARIQKSADDERRRIERDLHDGAQQRLVALRIKIELAAERLPAGPSADVIRGLGVEVETALDEVRSLAHGIYPPPLADRGLTEALRAAAGHSALPTTVVAEGVRERYPREVESAAYFCCLEALQNAAKHAHGATAAVIDLEGNGDGWLRFEVRDDGRGFDPQRTAGGMGMTSMHDRLAAVGGELTITSSPGRGTRVSGSISGVDEV